MFWPLKLVLFCCKNASIVTVGNNNNIAVKLIQELGRRISAVTQDTTETGFLFQRLSVCSYTTWKCGLLPRHFHHRINVAVVILIFFNIFCLMALCWWALKTNNSNNNNRARKSSQNTRLCLLPTSSNLWLWRLLAP